MNSGFVGPLVNLLLSGRKYKLVKKQIVQTTEDRPIMNLVHSGYVRRYLITPEGSLGVQVVYGPGDIFPVTLALKNFFNQPMTRDGEVFYYEAMCDSEVFTIEVEKLVEAVKTHPLIYRDLLNETGKRLHSTLQGLENVTLRSSYKRLAHQLAYFAERFGENTPEGTKIKIPLTHQELANILSVTRETVSTSMIELREKSLIVNSKQHLIVPNLSKLQKVYL
ncbi:MAG: Crp/Fnr family transcriptional regulator [Candidatus Saccharimonadales bacterium]